MWLHTAITAQPLYAKAYNLTTSYAAYAKDTAAAKTFTARVYPLIEPVAAPIVATSTPYVEAVLREAAPTAAGAPADDVDMHPVDTGSSTTVVRRAKASNSKAKASKAGTSPPVPVSSPGLPKFEE